jgi:hypothetical protein
VYEIHLEDHHFERLVVWEAPDCKGLQLEGHELRMLLLLWFWLEL